MENIRENKIRTFILDVIDLTKPPIRLSEFSFTHPTGHSASAFVIFLDQKSLATFLTGERATLLAGSGSVIGEIFAVVPNAQSPFIFDGHRQSVSERLALFNQGPYDLPQ